jgi:acetyl-CoA decarbonylase/synthase complex subunit delta
MKKLDFDRIISSLAEVDELELENVTINAEELVIEMKRAMMMPVMEQAAAAAGPAKAVDAAREAYKFKVPQREYKGMVHEITFGATRADGGTRGSVVKIGGQTTMYPFEGGHPNRPVVSYDVFDISQPQFPKALKAAWGDVMEDPSEWARKAVKLGADMITLHLVSTEPKVFDAPPSEAAKTMEDVLQAVKVPIVIGGSGNPKKDPEVFEKVCAAAEGEMCLVASANLDLDHQKVVDIANKYGHNVLSWVSLDINDQKTLNKMLLDEGLPQDRMVLDPTTAALGYGIEYTYTMIERVKQSALKGEKVLQNPISCGVTNAWAAREAWMNEPLWGPREHRGPLWETINSLGVLFAGADLMMMLHPQAVATVKEVIKSLYKESKSPDFNYYDWLGM